MATGNVLIVDDEQSIRRICSLYLKAEGINVATLEGADHIEEKVLDTRPDVIILDLNMPGTDGFRATQILRQHEETANIPILILSGRHDVEDKRNALLDCGADDYLTKPFDPKELIMRIELLRKRRISQLQLQSSINDLEKRTIEMQESLGEELRTHNYLQQTMLELLDEKYIAPLKMINQMVDSYNNNGASQSKKFSRLLERTRQLEHILSKLSEFQKYRKGEIQPNFRYITVGRLLNNLLDRYQEKAGQQNVRFEFYSPNPDFQVLTDPERVRRVISLLLDRALYITSSGKVECDVSIDDKEMRITIADNQPLEEDDTVTAGQPATRPDDSSDDALKARSMMLKLPLARNIIEKVNGDLIMSSQGSLGARISIKIPLKSE